MTKFNPQQITPPSEMEQGWIADHRSTSSPCVKAARWGAQQAADALRREPVIQAVADERERQDLKWGGPGHDDKHSMAEFIQWIEDYAGWARMMAACNSPDKAERRLIQVAALAVAAVQSSQRKRNAGQPKEPSAKKMALAAWTCIERNWHISPAEAASIESALALVPDDARVGE